MKVFFLAALALSTIFYSGSVHAQEEIPPVQQDIFAKARVDAVQDESVIEEYGLRYYSQELTIRILSGAEEGQTHTIRHEVTEEQQAQLYAQGDIVILGKTFVGGESTYYISDVYRLNALWWILAAFFVLTILCARWHGVRAFLGLGITFGIIGYIMIPYIVAGANPLLISLIGTIGIACIALYVAHGFTARTTIAFISTLITIAFAFGLGYLFISTAHLFGMGTEEAFYLQFAPIASIDLRGLLLGGIVLGALGVLDDVTTAQTAAVEELYRADSRVTYMELYHRGLSVGREHIVSLVNTLALAYTGASFPLLLLFVVYERPFWVTVNSEIILEEIIRMLVGSMSLVLAVPLTTLLASWFYTHCGRERLLDKS